MKSLLRCIAPALLLTAAPVVAQTQTGNGTSVASAPQPSRDTVMGALNGGAAGLTLLHGYLSDTAPPELVGRVDQLMKALHDQMATYDTATLLAAIDRVVEQARISLGAAHMLRLVVDPSYVPSRDVIRIALGEAGASPPSIKVNVPGDDPGPYRLLIATGSGSLGQSVVVNGVASEVRWQNPAEWIDLVMLGGSNGGVQDVASKGDTLRTATFSRRQIDDTRQQSGAIVVEAYAENGEINIQFSDAAPAFLMVERADRPSEFVLTPEARNAILPLDTRLAIEAEIQALAAALLEEIAPAAGPDGQPRDLPEPVFQSELTASPS